MSAPRDWSVLLAHASLVRERAHAPYSGYRVGAALVTADGAIFAGCNVENASYGVTICAERSAIVQMIAAGASDPVAIAVVTAGPEAGSPCGVCRQTLAEFAVDLEIALAVAGASTPARTTTLAALLPDAFQGRLVTG